MIVPKIAGLNELGHTSLNSPSSPSLSSISNEPTSPKNINEGPMTPRTLFSKREISNKTTSYIIEDKQYLYILCRGCKMCNNKYQHYMTIKKHLKKKKKFGFI